MHFACHSVLRQMSLEPGATGTEVGRFPSQMVQLRAEADSVSGAAAGALILDWER